MDERILFWQEEVKEITSNFKESFGSLSERELNWKPNYYSWSIAQVTEHLIITSESYFLIPEKIRDRKYKPPLLSKIKFFPYIFGKLILKGVDPNNTRKVKTGKVFEPSKSNIPENILIEFTDSQTRLIKFLENNYEMIESRTIISSPLNKNIVYHFDTVIDIIVNHQKRHFNQAKQILNMQLRGDLNG